MEPSPPPSPVAPDDAADAELARPKSMEELIRLYCRAHGIRKLACVRSWRDSMRVLLADPRFARFGVRVPASVPRDERKRRRDPFCRLVDDHMLPLFHAHSGLLSRGVVAGTAAECLALLDLGARDMARLEAGAGLEGDAPPSPPSPPSPPIAAAAERVAAPVMSRPKSIEEVIRLYCRAHGIRKPSHVRTWRDSMRVLLADPRFARLGVRVPASVPRDACCKRRRDSFCRLVDGHMLPLFRAHRDLSTRKVSPDVAAECKALLDLGTRDMERLEAGALHASEDAASENEDDAASEEDAVGTPKPFRITMLWDVLQTLMPTQEIAHFSWTKALEDSYCTSTLGTATMSLVADLFHFRAADLFCRPAGDDFARPVQTGAALAAIDEALGANAEEVVEDDDPGGWRAAEGRAAGARAAAIARRALAQDFTPSFYDFRRILQHAGDALGAAEADALRRQLTARRRARGQFRERCRAELVLGDAERVVDAVFGDAPDHDGGGAEMGARCSALFPSLLEAALFHRGQSLVQWAEGQCAVVDVGANPLLGTRAHLNYSTWQSRDGNARCYDTAWIELRDPERKRLTTFDAVAEHLVNCGADHYRFFGLHSEAISDSLWLLTRKDNWRRLPMQPTKHDAHWRPGAAMVAPGGEPLGAPHNLIRPAPIDHPRAGCVLVPPARADAARGVAGARGGVAEARKRHRAAHVPDSALQRRVDALLVHGRLPALNPLISSNIALAAPIRFQSDVLQANVGALVDHISLLAESSLRCATTPGLRNMQEAFAAGANGPAGMAAPERGAGDDGLDAALAGDAPRAAGDADDVADGHHTLPYSWDMVQIAMALETVERFYDDTYDQRLLGTLAYLRERGVDVDAHEARFALDAAPHTTLLFPGYSEDRGRRQTLSACSARARADDQRPHVVRDDDDDMRTVTRDTVSKAIGRNATHADRRRFVAQERGDLSIRESASNAIRNTTASDSYVSYVRGDPLRAVFTSTNGKKTRHA